MRLLELSDSLSRIARKLRRQRFPRRRNPNYIPCEIRYRCKAGRGIDAACRLALHIPIAASRQALFVRGEPLELFSFSSQASMQEIGSRAWCQNSWIGRQCMLRCRSWLFRFGVNLKDGMPHTIKGVSAKQHKRPCRGKPSRQPGVEYLVAESWQDVRHGDGSGYEFDGGWFHK